MLPMNVGQAKNGQATDEIEMSDTIRTFVLDGATEVSLTVPDNANKVNFGANNSFYWSRASFTLPAGTTVNTSTIELNPATRSVTAGETLYLRSISADTHVQLCFYKGGA